MPVKYLGSDVNPFKRQCTLKDFFSADPPPEAETPASPPMSPSTPVELPPMPPMPPMPLSPREVGQQRKAMQAILQAPTGAIAQIEYEAATGQGSSSWPVDLNAPSADPMLPSSDEESESDDTQDTATLIIESGVYKWTFDNPEHIHVDHPLFGIKYFGQVARKKGTAIEQCDARWYEERVEANKKDKEVGLMYMIRTFGYEAATRRIIETFKGPILEARNWANARESALIAEHGGPLRDVDRRLRQTLNLTDGGQGDAVKKWYAIEAISQKRWNKYKKLLQAFYDREGDINVPTAHVEDGVALGSIVSSMRVQGCFLTGHPEREEWVRAHGWVDNARDERWERVKQLLQAFYDREGHLNVPQAHVEDGEKLGQIVRSMRGTRADFLGGHPEREAWVRERGWVDNANDERWERVQQLLQAFYDREGHLNVPNSHVEDGEKLGQIVNGMRGTRANYLAGHPEREAWVRARGWVDNADDARWERVEQLLQAFYDREGHINVPQAHVEDGEKLGQIVSSMRSPQAIFLKNHPERKAWLCERGWVDNAHDARWERVKELLQAFYDREGHPNVPQRHVEDGVSLGQIVNSMRSHELCFLKGHPDRAQWCYELGFKMHTKDPAKNRERWAVLGVVA